MSSDAAGLNPDDPAHHSGNVVAFFVCPGAKEVMLPHALFPYGDGCSEMEPCPRRTYCLWFASHDLGGKLEFSDVPSDAQLPGNFNSRPFSCPRFRAMRQRRLRREQE